MPSDLGTRRPRRTTTARRRTSPDALTGRVRAHNPFELIRWLALSQPDPRKALAELVQNSLDANAHQIRITRLREKGVACLRIFDDGDGVIPEMDRRDALRYIATHIGHSRKRSLSPEQRLALMTQGQYGIGLLGFWSLGQMLEMRTSVPGQKPHRLVLHRDRPDYLIEPMRGRLGFDERWTEVVIVDLQRTAVGAVLGRRAADYLASELRGQLLARDVDLAVEDRMSRGTAQKVLRVRPPRFLGERIEAIGPIEVAGYPPIRFEVYLSGGEGAEGGEPRGLALYAAGTLVAENFHDLAALGLDRSPWTDARLSGIVDFPGFRVAPGSRRGIVVDEAAAAFAHAIAAVEPILARLLESLDRRRAEELDRTLIRDLQRAFRDFYRHRPRYAMLPVDSERDRGAGPSGQGAKDGGGLHDGTAGGGIEAEAVVSGEAKDLAEQIPSAPPVETAYLLPPGPLATVRITPRPVRVECNGTRRIRAQGFDADNRPIEDPVTYFWSLTGAVGTLVRSENGNAAENQLVLNAAPQPAEGMLSVVARSGAHEARDEVEVEVLEDLSSLRRSAEGIPEPEFVVQPGASWRSRMLDDKRWQVNSGHHDYRAIVDQPALKLRYLAMLFAKEVVLRSHQDPRLDRPLEQLVEVATYADQNLASKKGFRRRGSRSRKE